jgi:TPP-dependent pyruvate/acetoin dehydrogenase alpha subunit
MLGNASADSERLLVLYRWLTLSRAIETECAQGNPRWFPAEGEEAVIVGTFFGLRSTDIVAPHYRGPFVVYLMRGADPARLAGQALGKANGYSRGRSVPFTGPVDLNVVPWVAGDLGTSLGVATGAALSLKYRQEAGESIDDVVVLSFGDGTANRGDFHEALNLAAVWKLPIVFVCQNNGWAISLAAATYLVGPSIASRAAGYGVPGDLVDGTDAIAVNDAVQAAVSRARAGDGPSLIEARCYRLAGHWAEDSATYRDPAEVAHWRERDPLLLARQALLSAGIDSGRLAALDREAQETVEAAFAKARQAPDAGPADLGLDEVYAPVEL